MEGMAGRSWTNGLRRGECSSSQDSPVSPDAQVSVLRTAHGGHTFDNRPSRNRRPAELPAVDPLAITWYTDGSVWLSTARPLHVPVQLGVSPDTMCLDVFGACDVVEASSTTEQLEQVNASCPHAPR